MNGGQQGEEVSIERLRFGLSPREEFCDADHVRALAEILDDVPPIVVHADTMRVIDGVHRVHAAIATGRSTIRAVMFHGDEAEAQFEAIRTNVAHGKPLTLREREAAAIHVLQLMPDWSDRRIAAGTGLSPRTVARIRARATADSARSRARVGRDGRKRPVDPSEVRRRVGEALRADPVASNRAIASRTGASQATVRDVRDRLKRGVSEVLENTTVRDNGSPSSSGSDAVSRDDVVPEDFTAWFEPRCIDDAHWQRFVTTIPLSRVYEVADAARRYSKSWRAFATALEDRARARRRTP